MVKPETFTFPESEDQLYSRMLACARPGGMVTKIAFMDNTAAVTGHPAWEPIMDGDFVAARDALTSVDEITQRLDWLGSCRTIVDEGGIFQRIHVVRDLSDGTPSEVGKPPRIDSPFYQFLALTFAYTNQPLGGEQSYAIPLGVAQEIGITSMANEAQVFRVGRRVKGVATVEYDARGEVVSRTMYPPKHAKAVEARKVLGALKDSLGDYLEDYRLPMGTLPEETLRQLDPRILPTELARQNSRDLSSFEELLPFAYRDTV